MDPISCAASITTLVGMSFKVIQFISKTKKGHSEREKLQTEIHNVYRVLLSIQDQFGSKDFSMNFPWFRCIDPLFKNGGDIALLGQVLGDIAVKLETKSKDRVPEIVKTLKWQINSSEVDAMTVQIEKIKTNIALAINRANLELSRNMNANMTQVQTAFTKVYLQQLINRISPLDFRGMQRSPQKRALERTGEWLFESMEYLGWADRRVPSLWCCGIPGAGKTFLASAAFDKLQGRCEDTNALITIIFFDFNDKGTHSVEAVLSSLLRQAVETRMDMNEEVRALFDGSNDSSKMRRPNIQCLQSAIKAEFEHFDHVYVILDGLDEIPSEKIRSEVLDTVEALDSRLQLMVSSRPLLDIENWFYGQARDHRCRIPVFSSHALSINHNSRNLPKSVDRDRKDLAPRRNEGYLACGVCQFIESSELPSYKPACYACRDCQQLVCSDCYDRDKNCIGSNCDRTRMKYLWPQRIEIAAQPNDLELYVRWRIAQSPTNDRHFSRAVKEGHDLKTDIINAVVQNSGKMFLLARFHMDKILNLATPREMLRSAKNLHDDIHLIYDDVFERISTFSVAPHIKQLIYIVSFARKPLDTASLEHAIAVALSREEIGPLDLPDATDLVNKCLGLVTVDNHDVVRLSHETVGDYMRQLVARQSASGDAVMAGICLSYLGHSAIRVIPEGTQYVQQLEAQKQKFPLLPYVAIYWGQHVRCTMTHDTTKKVQSLLNDEGRIAAIAQIMWYDNLEHGSGWDAEDCVTGLHLAAHFGLNDIISTLLAKGENVNDVDCIGTTPLMYAVSSGHSEAVRVILHAGADASLRCKRGRTALHRACSNMDATVTQQLVDLPGDIAVNAIDAVADHQSALHVIAGAEKVEILDMLLSRLDIDVNLPCGNPDKCTALHSAVFARDVSILRILLNDKRIDVNATNSSSRTALSLACSEDNYDAVALLLEYGVNPHIADIHGGPPLLRAIDHNSFNSVRLLVNADIDYRFVDSHRRGALHGCAVNNRPEILRYLLQNRTDLDPNAQGDRGETPLHDAVVHGHKQVVAKLLEFGARTDICDNVGRTPLRAALETNQTGAYHMLVKARKSEQAAAAVLPKSTPIDSDSPERETITRVDTLSSDNPLPIYAAVRCLNAAEFRDYIEAQGSDLNKLIDQPDNDSKQTALSVAVIEKQNKLMRLLIERGASLDIQDMWGWTALHHAAQRGNLEAVKELVQRNCSMNLRDKLDRTPFDFVLSSRHKNIEIAFFIIRHGGLAVRHPRELIWLLRAAIDCNELEDVKRICAQVVPYQARIEGRLTPYQLAKKKGHTEIATFLLEESRRLQVVGRSVASPDTDPPGHTVELEIAPVPFSVEAKPTVDDTTGIKSLSSEDVDASENHAWQDRAVLSILVQLWLTTREWCFIATILLAFLC